jgi:hypothetical protein
MFANITRTGRDDNIKTRDKNINCEMFVGWSGRGYFFITFNT